MPPLAWVCGAAPELLAAFAIGPPQWEEFAKGEFVDTANLKTAVDGFVTAAYIRSVSAGKQVTTLYEVDCKADEIRVHSETPRYRRVPVDGGGSVVEVDDGFRTVTRSLCPSQNRRNT